MGKLRIDILLYNNLTAKQPLKQGAEDVEEAYESAVIEQENVLIDGKAKLGHPKDVTQAFEKRNRKSQGTPDAAMIFDTQDIDLMQSTYAIRYAAYDFMSLTVELFNSLNIDMINEVKKRETALYRNTGISHLNNDQDNGQTKIDFKWSQDEPRIVKLENFILRNKEHISSLEFLLGLINAESVSKNIPDGIHVQSESELLEVEQKLHTQIEKSLRHKFNTAPLRLGLSFLQQNIEPPLILRVSKKKSISGTMTVILYFCAPLIKFDNRMEKADIANWLQIGKYLSPATIRMTHKNVLVLEQIQQIYEENIKEIVSTSIDDFCAVGESVYKYVVEEFTEAQAVDAGLVDYLFRVPSFTNIDIRQNELQWSYLRGKSILKTIKKTSFNSDLLEEIKNIEPSEVRDLLFADEIDVLGKKRMLQESIDMVTLISATGKKMISIRNLAEIFAGYGDQEALRTLLDLTAEVVGQSESFQENLNYALKDILLIYSDKLGLDQMMELFPVGAPPQIRLTWLSTVCRTFSNQLKNNEIDWLKQYADLANDIEFSPYLFKPLLDELLEFVYAISLVPDWRQYENDLKQKIRNVAELSEYKSYYLHRLRSGRNNNLEQKDE